MDNEQACKESAPGLGKSDSRILISHGEKLNTLALDAKGFVRPALRFFAIYLSVILISPVTMVIPAHAEGSVQSLPYI